MAIEFAFDSQRKVLFTRAAGLVTFEEVLKHLDEERADELVACQEIFDASAAWTEMTPNEVRQIVARFHAMMREGAFGPTAVVTGNDVFFGMARMIAILSELQEGPRVAVFRNVDEGLIWLETLD